MVEKFDNVAYFMGHKGTHVENGIYKIDEPYEVPRLNIFDGDDVNSCGVLYKNCGNKIVQVQYFIYGYEEREKLYEYLIEAGDTMKDLNYIEPADNRYVGGL